MRLSAAHEPGSVRLCLNASEAAALRDELEHYATAVSVDEFLEARVKTDEAASPTPITELVFVSRLLEQLQGAVERRRRIEVFGPSWLLRPVIRGAALHAVDQLASILHRFSGPRCAAGAKQLRTAAELASAFATAVIDVDREARATPE